MYEAELKFLDSYVHLIEDKRLDRLFEMSKNYCKNNNIVQTNFWNNILTIFYDSDVNINPFENMTDIPDYYHYACDCCPTHILLDPDTTHIGYAAFSNTDIEEISGPESLLDFRGNIFENCVHLKKVDFILRGLGNGLFRNCRSLKEVKLADDLIIIDREAFKGCTSLANIVIPDTVHYIESKVFAGCTSLKQINIPAELKELNLDAFEDCPNLTYVYEGKTYSTIDDLCENLDPRININY